MFKNMYVARVDEQQSVEHMVYMHEVARMLGNVRMT